jgi:KaiC/GvpD/RAD55 family RecA-like ATPase
MEFPLQEIKDEEIYLIMASATDIRSKNIELIKVLLAKDYHVLIITTNQPYDILRKNYEKNGIAMEKIVVVDTVTKYALGHDHEPVRNCRFVGNPADMTSIGIAVTESLSDLKGKKVSLLFDSVNSMLIYISSQNITRFVHFVTNRLRLMGFSGIFLAVEKGLDPDVLTQLMTFVDDVVDVDKNKTGSGSQKKTGENSL